MLLGIDTGGTFTDFVFYDGQDLRVHKVLSTPAAPERAILKGIGEMGISLSALRLIHGSTVATNAVLEGKGARTVFITNRGFADLLSIGRQARRELYNLQPEPSYVPVARALCLETGGRLTADGSVVDDLSERDLEALGEQLRRLSPRAVAINLLFSFLDDRFERAIEQVIPKGVFVSRSSAVLPEYKEYERGITTWLNAYVGPLVQGYLERLVAGVTPAGVSVMQSSGQTIEAAQASDYGVHMLLSGPAGGLAGAGFFGQLVGRKRLLSFDMGGTSTDVALIDGDVRLTTEGHVGPFSVGVPMVDMHTIGAGGGSIAYADAGGLLQVGPESAGADPGPACYGQGGKAATVTDANLILGRLRADAFLGGAMPLDTEAARRVVSELARPLGLTLEEAAAGTVQVANEHMARALRVISVQKGVDPRDMTLICFGGAGGLHVCALAEALDMHRALVPAHAGVLSALGMLVAPPGRQLSRTLTRPLTAVTDSELASAFSQLEGQGTDALAREGVELSTVTAEQSLDLRYRGQSYTLNVPWVSRDQAAVAFHDMHARRYGHRLRVPVELVNIRVALQGRAPAVHVARAYGTGGRIGKPAAYVPMHGFDGLVPSWERSTLAVGSLLTGPALITETVATSYLSPGWQCQVDAYGNLLLDRERHGRRSSPQA